MQSNLTGISPESFHGRLSRLYKNHETLGAFLFFLALWFGILIITGSLFSGYHFMDDHETVRMGREMSNSSFSKEIGLFVEELFSSTLRFRPLYNLHRHLTAAVLGPSLLAWSIYSGFLAVFTSFFLFRFMRKTGFSIIESTLFPCLTLLGEQAAIWWKLGPAETPGMLILSAVLLCMASAVYASPGWKKHLYEFLFVFLTVLVSFCKESFVLFIPALLFWKMALTFQRDFDMSYSRGNGQMLNPNTSSILPTIGRAIKQNLVSSVLLLGLCVAELLHIAKSVTMTKVRYNTGSVMSLSVSEFLNTLGSGIMAVHGWVILFQFAVIGAIIFLALKKKQSLTFNYTLAWGFVLSVIIWVPQVVLYTKSGIYERYLLPGVIGCTFLTVLLLRLIRENVPSLSNSRKEDKKDKPVVMRLAYLMILILVIGVSLQGLRVTRYTAIGFAREGKNTNAWFESIRQNTKPDDIILVITDPFCALEASFSLQIYLDVEMNRKNTVFSNAALVTVNPKNKFWHELNGPFIERFKGFSVKEGIDRIKAVLIFPGLEKKFLKVSGNAFGLNPGSSSGTAAPYTRYSNEEGFVSYYKSH